MDITNFSEEHLKAHRSIEIYSQTLIPKYKQEGLSDEEINIKIREWIIDTYEYYTGILKPSEVTIFFNYLNKTHGLEEIEIYDNDKNIGR